MKYQDLIKTPEYWTTKIQLDLFTKVEEYMKNKGINRTQLAKELNVSKGYITQILNGDFDHRISKLVELAIAIGYYPNIQFKKDTDETLDKQRVLENVFQQLDSIEHYGFICSKKQSQDIGSFSSSNILEIAHDKKNSLIA
jgi:transcriptional regulator with XRE-family HTH domain